MDALKVKKSSKKAAKNELDGSVQKVKKAKKVVEEVAGDVPATVLKTKKKKRSAEEAAAAEGTAEKPAKKKKAKVEVSPAPSAADSGESEQSQLLPATGGKKKTSAGAPTAEEPEKAEAADPLSLDNFGLSSKTKELLRAKGINALFPIQAQTFATVTAGNDLVGRARTGQGKTLAFVLPIVECLVKANTGAPQRGRPPRVIVLAPTRELAKQVHTDFEYIGKAAGLATVCIYGGAPYGTQENALKRGVDVVVGTPGRVKDHLERKTLVLNQLKFRVLDECDEMLNMGFVDDVEKILTAGGADQKVQTLLFSATLPAWVKQITKRFLQTTHKLVDLVGTDKMQASKSVKHLVLPCHWSQRHAVAGDVVKCYGALGRTILFCETKRDCNELVTVLSEELRCRPLHGDIPQAQREVTLKAFREGKFEVLVATDVAARGLDIKEVELVLQTEPPKDPETYIHRSGRTGRAGSSGVSVTLVARNKEGLIPFIEKKAGLKFERIGAPQPQEMARIAGERAVEALASVEGQVVPWFQNAAKALSIECGGAEVALARALAKITGFSAMQGRSLLTANEEYVTLQLHASHTIDRPGFVFTSLKRHLTEQQVEQVKNMTLTLDARSACFDVPHKLVELFLEKMGRTDEEEGSDSDAAPSLAAGSPHSSEPYLTRPSTLPELKASERVLEMPPPRVYGRGASGGRGGGSRGGGGSRSSGGGRGGGRGGFGGRRGR